MESINKFMKNKSSLNWLRLHRYWAGNPLVAALLFSFVIFPLAIIFRIAGIDPLNKAIDPNAKTYWVLRNRENSVRNDIWRQD